MACSESEQGINKRENRTLIPIAPSDSTIDSLNKAQHSSPQTLI